uniref:KEAP1 n=1 Tax=Solanum tuberosum TaxID=4113 RepID=M1AV06_SOLTU
MLAKDMNDYSNKVQIRVRLHCVPLPEDTFRPVIKDNYFEQHHFWFELDHTQSSKLISQLSSLAYAPSSTSHYPALRRSIIQTSPANNKIAENRCSEPQNLKNKPSSSIDSQGSLDEKNFIYMKLKEIALDREWPALSRNGHAEENTNEGISYNDVSIDQAGFVEPQPPGEEKNEEGDCDLAGYPPFVAQLLKEVKELNAFKEQHTQKVTGLEKKLANAQEEINLLKGRCLMLESTNPSRTHDSANVVESDDIVCDESIILAGGVDGNNWLSALDLYSPLSDVLKTLKPMSSFRSYFAIANLSREVYVFGGKFGKLWDNTATELNALYAVGGFDGDKYLALNVTRKAQVGK